MVHLIDPMVKQSAIYRIVQESLTHVVRHAGAVRATVRMCYTGTEREVPVEAGPPAEWAAHHG